MNFNNSIHNCGPVNINIFLPVKETGKRNFIFLINVQHVIACSVIDYTSVNRQTCALFATGSKLVLCLLGSWQSRYFHAVYMRNIINEYVTQSFTTLRKSITARKSNLFTVYLRRYEYFRLQHITSIVTMVI